MTAYSREPRPEERRRRRGRGWLILLAVIILLLVAADRVGVVVADRVIASKVQQSQDLAHKPNVSIEGFPFLTQAIGNDYHSVRMSGHDVTVGTSTDQVTLDSFQGRLSEVKTIDHFHGITAERGTGTATLGYAELSRLLGAQVGFVAGGRIQASRSIVVQGQAVTGSVSAVLSTPDGVHLTFSDVKVSVPGAAAGLPASVTDQLGRVFARTLSLGGLPFGLKITQLAASSSGVQVSAVASNIRLTN